MEGHSDYNNPLDMMPMNYGVNDLSYGGRNDPNQLFLTTDGRIEDQHSALPLPQWVHQPPIPKSYVEFLAENSAFTRKVPPASDVMEDMPQPVCSGSHLVQGIAEIHREFFYNNLGSGTASGSKTSGLSADMDFWKVKPSYVVKNENIEPAPEVICLKPHREGEQANYFGSLQHQSHTQYQTSWTQEPVKDGDNISRKHPQIKVAPSVYLSKPHPNKPKQRPANTDQQRRLRIAERVKALQHLLPCRVEGSQAAIMDDIIDHIKYLQLQIKELSRSRLGGESTSGPFVFLEGYGHYVVHEHMTNEPLEEMIGLLLEVNPSAATKLLQSRGLIVKPMAFSGRPQQ